MASLRRRETAAGSVWYVRYRSPDGRQREKRAGKTRRDAEFVLRDLERQIDLGGLYESPPEPFGVMLDAYLDRLGLRIRASTMETTRTVAKHLERLRPISLDRLKAADVEDVVTAIARAAPSQANRVLVLVKQVIKDAKRRDARVDERIFDLAPIRSHVTEMRFLSWPEVETLASWMRDDWGRLVQVAALTGLRQGEIFALRKEDVDFERRVVRVDRSVYRGRVGPPKTRSSRRQVALSTHALRLVREQLVARNPNKLDLVWPGDAGGHVAVKGWMSNAFRPAVRHAGLAPFRFHDLRHTYVALLIAAEAHPKWLQSQLGHSTISLTLDRYGHLFPDASEPFMQRLDELTSKVGDTPAVGSAGDEP